MIYYSFADRKENKIALTFDDGPNPPFTLKILDILDDFEVKGNFFVIGKWAKQYPAAIEEIYRRGHLIGNHSYNHELNNPEFETADAIIYNILKIHPIFARPPYCYPEAMIATSQSPLVLNNKIKIIVFDVDPNDNHQPGEEIILKRILDQCQNGSIIDLHDGSENPAEWVERPQQMINVLDKIIKSLKTQFKISRLDEMNLIPQTFKNES